MPEPSPGVSGDPPGPRPAGSTPGPHPGGPSRFSPFRIGVAVVLVAAALIAWTLTGSAASTYRTAEVGTGTVESTLDAVGTVTPVNQADLDFNASGTVSAVDVSVGQPVSAGQTLASLDVATLDAAVTSAQASLASSQATLASAEASETSTATTAAPATVTTTTTPTAPPSTGQTSTQKQQIAKLQAALVAAQTQADTDSSQATAALAGATTACGSPPVGTGSPPTTTIPGSTTTTTTAPAPGGAGSTSCSQALSQASTAQAKVSGDLKKVSEAEAALNAALTSAGSSGGSTGGETGSRSGTASGTTSAASTTSSVGTSPVSAGTGKSGSGGASSKPASPQQLVVDQASIDTAEANLADAQQALAGANLVSTIAGTVAAVSVAVGDSVTAGSSSSSPQVVVIGTGSSYEVSTSVPVADIAQVAVGQQAVVTPDSTNSVEAGHVSSIGVLATSSTTTTTYPVVITLSDSNLGQLSGAEADVSIVVKRSVGVTTVPTSAVRSIGTRHLVTTVENGTAKEVAVSIGTVGDLLTQVTSGLSPGQVVSLASMQEPLPSTSTTTTRTGIAGLRGAGGFGGAGGFAGAGGFGGARLGG